jgi:Tn3 transposase DDE domain
MNSCSKPMLILACVIYWQAKEISRVVRCRNTESDKIEVSLLEYVSPIEWDNVILYGQNDSDGGRIR